ncbi:tripartite tricarboxylate transporter permease, partial [Candidatus Micrarchaeota archaeon]|nr:tripartite tricarboxylate transporter permease [Candidatus Micrarchaeota archaeon]
MNIDAIYIILGILVGLITGIVPGLHSNTVIAVISSLGLDQNAVGALIIALFPAHLIASFIPSIFFGVPDSETLTVVLPGQRMVREGKGIIALKVALLSSLFAAALSSFVFYPSLNFFTSVYSWIAPYIKYILLIFCLTLTMRTKRPAITLVIFVISGALGYVSLKSGVYDPFLPLFSGMFAIASMINYSKGAIGKQHDFKLNNFGFLLYVIVGVGLGANADLLPGVGSPAQIAAIATIFIDANVLNYLALVSSISVSESIFSLATAASIN